MFDELDKYENNDHFFFTATDALEKRCNAPAGKNGVYIVFTLKGGRIDMVYIGPSGKKLADGSISTSSDSLKDTLINGHQFGKIPRKQSWPIQILSQNIEALDVYWWVTYDEKYKDLPWDVECIILNKYLEIYGVLPKWNKKYPKKLY